MVVAPKEAETSGLSSHQVRLQVCQRRRQRVILRLAAPAGEVQYRSSRARRLEDLPHRLESQAGAAVGCEIEILDRGSGDYGVHGVEIGPAAECIMADIGDQRAAGNTEAPRGRGRFQKRAAER